MSTPKDKRQQDLFRPALDSVIDLNRPLVRLAQRIDWTFLERRLGASTGRDRASRPCRCG
jgi:IS5 family transposase